MTRVVITGYASLDHAVLLGGPPAAGVTTRMRRLPGAWPRLGGSPAYVAAALVAGGVAHAMPLTWIGTDAAGDAYRQALEALGVPCDGVASVAGAPTPVAILAYAPDGGCYCLYDPGREPAALTPVQSALLATADWVCVTVGPPQVTDTVLQCLAPSARLAWAVKHDQLALSSSQAMRLAARADLICCSQAEGGWVAAVLADAGSRPRGAMLVETHGAAGARIAWDGHASLLPAVPVPVMDPTGAGDTLVGGVIAGLLASYDDKPAALRTGMAAAADLLRARYGNEAPS